MSTPPLLLTITGLLNRIALARATTQSEHAAGEGAKRGTLRGGTCGVLSEQGDVAGKCHRVAHLRSLGHEVDPPSPAQHIMFELGFATEDTLAAQIRSTLQPGEVLLCEEQIPIQWTTSNGTPVTGRPDLVICRKQVGTSPTGDVTEVIIPITGVEVKSAHSTWTARDVLFDAQPKLEHLIQAAHYAYRLGVQYGDGTAVPYYLYYKSHSHHVVPSWAGKLFPRPGQPGSEYVEYNQKGDIKHIKPWEIAYEIRIAKDGRVSYRRDRVSGAGTSAVLQNDNSSVLPDTERVSAATASSEWVSTVVNVHDVTRYYEYVAEMGTSKQLGPRPMTIDTKGLEKTGYTSCDYCPLQDTCDKHEKAGYSTWLEQVYKKLSTPRAE